MQVTLCGIVFRENHDAGADLEGDKNVNQSLEQQLYEDPKASVPCREEEWHLAKNETASGSWTEQCRGNMAHQLKLKPDREWEFLPTFEFTRKQRLFE